MATSLDVSPSQEPHNKLTHAVFATVLAPAELYKPYSDQTGKFPLQSSRGYNYDMVLYSYDSNAILTKTLKTPEDSIETSYHKRSSGPTGSS